MTNPLTDYLDRAIAELEKPENAGDRRMILRFFLGDGAYLSLKPEWDMDDNFNATEGTAEMFRRHAPSPTAAECEALARDWEFDEYTDAGGEILALTDEDEDAEGCASTPAGDARTGAACSGAAASDD